MRAFMVYEPGRYGIVDVPVPCISDDEILVKVGAAAICHSDLDILDGRRTHYVSFPLIPGHEFAGTVVEAGKLARNVKVGDAVVCECIVWCGECDFCRKGLTGICRNFSELGTMRNGGFAEYAAVPARLAHPFKNITMDDASNVEPAGNAFHAVEAAEISAGDVVVVIGPGPIGLYATQIAGLERPGMLIAVGTRDERLDVARRLGATHTVNVGNEDALGAIMGLTGGRGADKVLQCATTGAALELAFQTAGVNATIILEGMTNAGCGVGLDFDDIVKKTLSINGVAGVYSGHYSKVLGLMEQGIIKTDCIITHRMPLSAMPDAIWMLKHKTNNAIKVVINP